VRPDSCTWQWQPPVRAVENAVRHTLTASTTPFPRWPDIAPLRRRSLLHRLPRRDSRSVCRPAWHGQYQPGSIRWQSAEQPSPSLDIVVVAGFVGKSQFRRPQKETFTQLSPTGAFPVRPSTGRCYCQPSPIAVLPSSHSSPGSQQPSPQMTTPPVWGAAAAASPRSAAARGTRAAASSVAHPTRPPLPPLALLLWSHALPSKTANRDQVDKLRRAHFTPLAPRDHPR